MPKSNFDELFNEALKMHSSGHDDLYIELQFSEQGIDKTITKEVLKKIKSVRKGERKTNAVKFIIGGLATILVGVLFTLISYKSGSPVTYLLYGLITTGVMSVAKGIVDLF
jgi:hypothetical protein